MEVFLEAADVARSLKLVPATIRWLARIGRLRVAARTARGVNLFRPEDVEALRCKRDERSGHGSVSSEAAVR